MLSVAASAVIILGKGRIVTGRGESVVVRVAVDQTPRLYRITEVAQIFGVSPRTVRRWIADGTLSVIRLGRVVRVPDDEIRNLRDTA
jgi:excisionase family DNA binding protein